jgi:hypothetical protein
MKANSLLPPGFYPSTAGPPGFRHKGSFSMYEQLLANIQEAQMMLSRYTWTFLVQPDQTLAARKVIAWKADSEDGEWERRAILQILRYLPGDGPQDHLKLKDPILRFRRCKTCGSWTFAIRSTKQHCGPLCRQQANSKTQDYLEKRQEYMRGYRQRDRERAAKQASLEDLGMRRGTRRRAVR